MRVVMIHGINNQNNTTDRIREDWWDAIVDGWAKAGLAPKSKPAIDVAYYADKLAAAEKGDLSRAIAMGGGTSASRSIALEFLQEYMDAGGVSQDEIGAVAEAMGAPRESVAQGPPHEGWIINLAGILERILPSKGKFIARLFLRQAAFYIENEALRDSIDAKVKAQVCDGKEDPAIVIAHSLGTVVAYRIFANKAQEKRNVTQFVTLGSPLGVAMFKKILPPRGQLPDPPLKKWLNARHKEDFVTLGRAITQESIGFTGVVDDVDIVNDEDDKHSITHYLSSPSVAKVIHAALP